MKKEDWILISAVGGLVVAIISLLMDRQMLVGGAAGDYNVTTGDGPSFVFTGRGPGSGTAVPNGPITSSCGCGGSFGDYATPALSSQFADSIRLLPGEKKPQPYGAISPVKLLPN